MELQTSFSYYPKEYLFLASSLERRVKNCLFMGRQLPKKISRKSNLSMGRASWSPGSGTGTGEPLKQNCAAEAAAELPWQVPLGEAWDSLVCGSPRWSKVNRNERKKKKKKEGEQWEKEMLFTLYAAKIKPHCTGAGFRRMFCLRPWLSPSQFKSPVWYTVMPITTSPVLPSFHTHFCWILALQHSGEPTLLKHHLFCCVKGTSYRCSHVTESHYSLQSNDVCIDLQLSTICH